MANTNIYANSTTTVKTAKITSIKQGNESEHYFAKVSCLTGKDKWQHLSLLVSKNLHPFAKRVIEGEQNLEDINPCSVELNDLFFKAAPNSEAPNSPYLNNDGILVGISRSVF